MTRMVRRMGKNSLVHARVGLRVNAFLLHVCIVLCALAKTCFVKCLEIALLTVDFLNSCYCALVLNTLFFSSNLFLGYLFSLAFFARNCLGKIQS